MENGHSMTPLNHREKEALSNVYQISRVFDEKGVNVQCCEDSRAWVLKHWTGWPSAYTSSHPCQEVQARENINTIGKIAKCCKIM